jgi:uncharacterized protein YneF (UPF0154 family)
MARKTRDRGDMPIGPLLVKNLYRLGYADLVVRSAELSRLVERTGHKMSRQRIAQMMNAVRVEDETIAVLAKAIGVKPSELLRSDED